MSFLAQPISTIPELTDQVTKQAFPEGNLYMRIRNELGCIYSERDFATLFPPRARLSFAAWRLVLITIMQYIENLTDRQAAEMVRGRIDWKYVLGLELTDSGFDSHVLSEFRTRLLEGSPEKRLFELVLERLKQCRLLMSGAKQHTDSSYVLATLRSLNRTEKVAEMLRATIHALAIVAPTWLRQHLTPEWFERYFPQIEEYRVPKTEEARNTYIETVGTDGIKLLQAIYAETTPPGETLRAVEEVETLKQLWVQHFYFEAGQLCWREVKDIPTVPLRHNLPCAGEACYVEKRGIKKQGYEEHMSEGYTQQQVRLLTHELIKNSTKVCSLQFK
ncbi:MAG: transposase [Chloroflexi bacterium]|uniref:Transposase n=1 Tax=Candidatus Chlorohelix allophototropha TaxID=3003348 RepID=A0A8T7M1V8_9CHLR|nr:transposase [Chloroflexota bacterium]WJW65499.1 transposase [Chloroflexota bacterium L227-S17]